MNGVNGADIPLILLAIVGGAAALGLAIAVLVIAIKITGGIISAIVWLVKHIVGYVFGTISDVVRLVGALVATLVAIPFATGNVVLARWKRAEHWGRALKREILISGYLVWSILIRRPLKLLCLHGVLEGVEGRLPQSDASVSAPAATSARTEAYGRRDPVAFEDYEIEGTLRPGGSGAKLYVAAPSDAKRSRLAGNPSKVVIKSFALEEGSSLPQIVRESRALDAARAMGLVLDHGLDDGRFWYAMPYHPGDNLNETTHYLHARSGPQGLEGEDLAEAISYGRDLVGTLARYHAGGLWHKDVKPDNIIVHDGKAHLVDLGLVTPLRSAMTLTTHGTEYFRDPEMVRQALRGVRVHQVDGAKFDVYGAGAVLYFMLENTFPAHGGLSAFSKRSPEALRWIVRRAMADYHQRYASADTMLADLNAVAMARDPWSVKPIELPSMRRVDLEGAAAMGPGIGYGAGTPAGWMPPPAVPPMGGPGVGAGMGLGGGSGGDMRASAATVADRPRLIVTNWWHGSYASPDIAARERDLRAASGSGREAVDRKREGFRGVGFVAGRNGVRSIKQVPSRLAATIGIVLFTVLVISLTGRSFHFSSPSDEATVTANGDVVSRSTPSSKLTAPEGGARLLVVNDHPTPASSEVQESVDQVLQAYEERGFTIVRDDAETAARASLAFAKIRSAATSGVSDTAAEADVEAAIATGSYFGILHVEAPVGEGSPLERLLVSLEGEKAKAYQKEMLAKKKAKSRSSTGKATTSKSSTTSARNQIREGIRKLSESGISIDAHGWTLPPANPPPKPAPPAPPEPPQPPVAPEADAPVQPQG